MAHTSSPGTATSDVKRVSRSRWAAIGAAVAVTLGAGGLVAVDAASVESSFTAIEPTRVLDTRINAGLTGAFTAATPRNLDVTGTIDIVLPGDQLGTGTPVPDGATSIVANVTVTEPTTGGFVSLRPGTATGTPTTSTVNFLDGQTVANSATVEVPPSGEVQLYYHGATPTSTAHIIIDIVGYHTPAATTGPPGPAGDTGPAGPKGDTGATGAPGDRGFSAWDEIPSGQTVIGEHRFSSHHPGNTNIESISIDLPGLAPGLTDNTVNFADDEFGDGDTECAGNFLTPSAPPDRLCIYMTGWGDINTAETRAYHGFLGTSFYVDVRPTSSGQEGNSMSLSFTWAYTAP